MNRFQFLSLLIPSLSSVVLVLLAWMYTNARLTRLEGVVDSVARDLREFYRMIGRVEGRVEEIAKR